MAKKQTNRVSTNSHFTFNILTLPHNMLQADRTLTINLIKFLLAYYHLLYNITTEKYSKDNKKH